MLCVFVFLLSHCLENIFNDDEKEAGVGDVLLQSLVLRFFSSEVPQKKRTRRTQRRLQ